VIDKEGKLAEGAKAFTLFIQNGQIGVRGFGNFVPTITAATEKLLREKFQ
jgi:hypothetical protein